MDLGIGHYDDAPPARIDHATLEQLRDADRLRFANRLEAWVDVVEGRIVDAGYSGTALVGSTTATLFAGSVTFPGVGFPILTSAPEQLDGATRFVQTAGGRTGSPLPRRIDRPPYVRITAPTAWTTLALTIAADGASTFELVGASSFPRHWVYDADGVLAAKSGTISFEQWTRTADHDRTPWGEAQNDVIVSAVESEMERALSGTIMQAGPRIADLAAGTALTTQGEPGSDLYLVLDGILDVVVDGEAVAELGPGAIVGERAVIEGGHRTSTVTAVTDVKVAGIPGEMASRNDLAEIAAGHRREE
jgi:hypothetical protein